MFYKENFAFVNSKMKMVSIFHVLLIGPILMYIGYVKPSHKLWYVLLLIMTSSIFGAVIMHFIKNKMRAWFYVHMFLFATLLGFAGYIGVFKSSDHIPQYVFSFILAVGIAAFGYHLIHLNS